MDPDNESALEIDSQKKRGNEQLTQEENETVDKTISKIECRDSLRGLELPNCSEQELLIASETNDVNEGIQTLKFNKFVAFASHLASAKFNDKLQHVPKIVEKIKDLMLKIKKEIKEFAKIAIEFEELLNLFVKIFMTTKHNFNMIKPNLENSVMHFTVLEEASKHDILNDIDKDDCTKALDSLFEGFIELKERSKIARKESGDFDNQFQELKKQCEDKKIVMDRNLELIWKKPEGSLSFFQYNGNGIFDKFNVLVRPVCKIFASSVVTAVDIGVMRGIIYLIKYLLDTHQEKALELLSDILSHLNELQNVKLSFLDYMNELEEKNNIIMNDFSSIRNDLTNGCISFRKNCSDFCGKASERSKTLIKIIEEIDKIELTSLSASNIIPDVNEINPLELEHRIHNIEQF